MLLIVFLTLHQISQKLDTITVSLKCYLTHKVLHQHYNDTQTWLIYHLIRRTFWVSQSTNKTDEKHAHKPKAQLNIPVSPTFLRQVAHRFFFFFESLSFSLSLGLFSPLGSASLLALAPSSNAYKKYRMLVKLQAF